MQTTPPPPPAGAPAAPAGVDGPMTTGQWVRLGLLVAALVLLAVGVGVWSLVIVVGLVALIFFHELGHYLAARRSGMKVTEFFIGFGPRIWSFRRGETEYGVKLIPAGAYVKIIGMHNLEEVDPSEEGRTYRQKAFWPRLSTVLAGVAMNFLLALVLIFTLLVGVGTPGGSLATAPDEASWRVGLVTEDSAAAKADIRTDDKIVAIDGTPVSEFADVRAIVSRRPGDAVDVVVERDGGRRTIPVVVGERDGTGFLGVARILPVQRTGVVAAVPKTFHEFGAITVGSLKALGGFFSPSGLRDFGGQVARGGEDPEPAVGTGSQATAADEAAASSDNRLISLLGIIRLGSELGEIGWSAILALFISINIFLGVVNLLPLLPFDGGHAVVAAYERVQERRSRRPGRYFADVARLLPLTYVVVLVLGMLFITTTYLDIVGPMSLSR